ncbi:DNA glycosylase AlkZ-like family protein, partial [Miniimonas arenae]|uniref:DNA glycosylase AlkZ-like family protein n=1 Tax=Miniimonas arenae TaxID=676201 RepID=UPI0028B1D4C5
MTAAGPPVMSLPQARRVAVAAQQLTGRRHARVTRANLARMTEHVGVLQIDSVSVLARAHLLPVLARLGPYDLAVLDRATARAPRLLVEEIAHEAAYVPPEVYALLAHRRAARREGSWALSFTAERADLLTRIQAVIGERGALTSREVERVLESPGGRAGWWEWSEVKTALELLFRVGDLAVAGRTAGF